MMHSNSLITKNGFLDDIKRNAEHVKFRNISFKLLDEAFKAYVIDFRITIDSDKIIINI
jgi:hypothetical protein